MVTKHLRCEALVMTSRQIVELLKGIRCCCYCTETGLTFRDFKPDLPLLCSYAQTLLSPNPTMDVNV